MKHELLAIIYRESVKKMKTVRKLITTLKKMDREFGVSPSFNEDHELTVFTRALREFIVRNMHVFF
jgi:hypothetical protein